MGRLVVDAVDGGGGLVEALLAGGGTKVLTAGGVVWEEGGLLLFLRFDENVNCLNRDVMSKVWEEDEGEQEKSGEFKKGRGRG